MKGLVRKAEEKHSLSEDEIFALLYDDSINGQLFVAADRVREKYVGGDVHFRGLIEFTNICRCNCTYCGLRSGNSELKRYRLDEAAICRIADKAAANGYKTVVLQGGEDRYFTAERLAPVIRHIKSLDMAITLSLGERSYDDYLILREAGADRYLLRVETTDQKLYEQLDPGMSLYNRMRCLNDLRELGYELGSGIMVGLPGQTLRSIARDILFFKNTDTDMIGIGPFIPHRGTPLKDATVGSLTLSLKVMAIVRLLIPDSNIPATTAMESLSANGRIMALQSGANVVMPNLTEGEARMLYEIYPNKAGAGSSPDKYLAELTSRIRAIGRSISKDYGFRKRTGF